MPLPDLLQGRLQLPVVAAPMFLASGLDLVLACCRAGIVGTFPALNQRTTEGFASWLETLRSSLGAAEAPFGVNLIVHRTNPRLQADLEMVIRHRVPVVITSLGAVRDVVDKVHDYGGVVFHDVTTVRHARKAAEAGVDGLILVAAGAGGHAGTINPFALLWEVRQFFTGTLLLAGALSTGEQIAAARLLGADLAYMGTRFIATRECAVEPAYKDMVVASAAEDIVYTPAISGIPANFMRPSLVAAGLDPDHLPADHGAGLKDIGSEAKAWKTVWSAGQGVSCIQDIPTVSELVTRLSREYEQALGQAGDLCMKACCLPNS
ncbi:nitronate monooxygenase [Haematospirillum jordaniae]|uniref:NAD(P)H-dependent flavin oxidoreductase n=1 Tax=Haematospirillum jordaniae TaxID=1549855 RepID=UPI0014332530|nr:nitronate monooxygenase [Haematospirillum jordaniae]NKD85635.1 nitronate monooxygenase [Haematospirillum jordaniae]